MSGLGRGCVKTLDAVVGTQQWNRRRSLGDSFAVSEASGLNQSCAQMARRKVFTQPRSQADVTALSASCPLTRPSGHRWVLACQRGFEPLLPMLAHLSRNDDAAVELNEHVRHRKAGDDEAGAARADAARVACEGM